MLMSLYFILKCSGSCNNINNPYAKLCIPDIVKKINVKVFNLISRINETKQILWHETCKCVCRLSVAICNSRQIWSDDKCRCECREGLADKINYDKGYLWNPSNCECECDKSFSIGEYLDYKNCICRKSVVDKLIEECDTVIKENNDILVNPSGNTIYFSLFLVFLLLFLIIIGVLIYFYWYKRKNTVTSTLNIRFNPKSQTNIKDIDLRAIGVNEISITNYEIEYHGNLIYGSPLYLLFNDVDAYFLSEEKYLVFSSTNKNKDILEYYKELWDTIRKEISRISEEVKIFDLKDLVKINFKSDDKAPLSKIINIPMCTIIIKSLFRIDGMVYPEIYLHICYLEYDNNKRVYA